MPGTEKRGREQVQEYVCRAPRFFTNFTFFVQIAPGLGLREARCYELAESGLAAQVAEPIRAGTNVTLLLTLPGDAVTLRIPAQVSGQRGHDHGFAFIFRNLEEQTYLHRYFASL